MLSSRLTRCHLWLQADLTPADLALPVHDVLGDLDVVGVVEGESRLLDPVRDARPVQVRRADRVHARHAVVDAEPETGADIGLGKRWTAQKRPENVPLRFR